MPYQQTSAPEPVLAQCACARVPSQIPSLEQATKQYDPEALRFTRQCLEADQRGARKIKEVTDDGGVVSAYYQLPGKDPDVNRFVLFKVNSKGTITLVYIEGELDSDDLITLLFTKKDL